MALPTKLNLKVVQGSTFTKVLRWESDTIVYNTISAITKAAPVSITHSNSNTIPNGWRVWIESVNGMTQINSTDYYTVDSSVSDVIKLSGVNSINYTAYTNGGAIKFYKPVDLTDYTAIMQIRPTLSSSTVIKQITSADGIEIDNTNKQIVLTLDKDSTALFDFKTAVYSLEMILNNSVIALITGLVFLNKEVTR